MPLVCEPFDIISVKFKRRDVTLSLVIDLPGLKRLVIVPWSHMLSRHWTFKPHLVFC